MNVSPLTYVAAQIAYITVLAVVCTVGDHGMVKMWLHHACLNPSLFLLFSPSFFNTNS